MEKLELYLQEFSKVADAYFKRQDEFLMDRYNFYKKFFTEEHIRNLTWEKIQKIGDNNHAFNKMALAREKALGRPNHDISKYKETFSYMAFSNDSIDIKIDKLIFGEYSLKNFGKSVITELIGYVNPEKYYIYNRRDKSAVEFLGINLNFKRGDSFGTQYKKYIEVMDMISEKYKEIVGKRTITTIPLEVDQFFCWLYEEIITKNEVTESEDNLTKEIRYWAIAPGENASQWEEWKDKSIIAVGWNELGDLRNYKDKESIKEKLKTTRGNDSDHKHSTVACYEFSRVMKPGDIVFIKSGTKHYLGIGEITSDYFFDNSNENYKHLRKVNWKIIKDILIPQDIGHVATKTMTDITKHPEYVNKVFKLFDDSYQSQQGILNKEDIVSDNSSVNYWWLNANPNIWSIEDYKIEEEQTYTSHNNQGNKRRIYDYFTKVKQGDLMIGYESSPVRKIKAIFVVTQPLHLDDDEGEVFTFKIKEFLPNQITWDDLCSIESFKDSEIMRNNQGSLFKLTKEEYESIVGIAKKGKTEQLEIYNKEIALKDLFISEDKLDSIITAIKIKKNIILQGPPGTGKTYIAKKIAYLMMGRKDNTKIEQVQFHQSYSYEDFIQGYRPSEKNNFVLRNGVFYDFCKRAQNDINNSYFFIVDEINRGNLSKIFGELMMLIENDKRGKDFAISLTYSKHEDDKFHIPENLFFIGTMNTADRSLALVDYALRRRFRFININPEFGVKFKNYLKDNNTQESLIDKIISGISRVNEIIAKDQNLGGHFAIGHSYFCNFNGTLDERFYHRIIENEIEPLLREYWFDDNDKVEECIRILKG